MPRNGPSDGLANRDQVWFRVACQHAASSFWDLLHIDLKTAFLQGELYDLERRVIHVQLPTDTRIASVSCRIVHPFSVRIE